MVSKIQYFIKQNKIFIEITLPRRKMFIESSSLQFLSDQGICILACL